MRVGDNVRDSRYAMMELEKPGKLRIIHFGDSADMARDRAPQSYSGSCFRPARGSSSTITHTCHGFLSVQLGRAGTPLARY
jgi:hypothetical protein